MALDVEVREYKNVDLKGGTLIVSVPHLGVGSLLVTDYLLDQLHMDQVAAFDSEAFPPIAMMRQGKPRFPIRVHVDPAAKLGVVRCEFTPPIMLARPMARTILGWAKAKGVRLVIALDGVPLAEHSLKDGPVVLFASNSDIVRKQAQHAKLREFEQGILSGVPARLLLESRFAGPDVLTLFGAFDNAVDDARTSIFLLDALRVFLPDLRLDAKILELGIGELERQVRDLQKGAEKALERLGKRPDNQPMYG